MFRKNVWVGAVLFFIVSFVFVTVSDAASKYAAKVNKERIENATLESAIDNFIETQKMMGMDVTKVNREKLRKDILDELIAAELLYQESKKSKLGNLSKEVEEQYEKIKQGFKTEEDFNNVLKERGISEKQLKDDIEKGIYINRFLNEKLYTDIRISEKEKKDEYEKSKDRLNVPDQVKASNILIRVAPDASDADKKKAKAKIEEIRKKAISGEDFAKLAKENSEDGSAPAGGDLGYFAKGSLVKEFEDVAFSAEIGKISDVITTQFGYHIVKVFDKKEAHLLTYKEVEKDIERFLENKKKREAVDKFVSNLIEKAKINIY